MTQVILADPWQFLKNLLDVFPLFDIPIPPALALWTKRPILLFKSSWIFIFIL